MRLNDIHEAVSRRDLLRGQFGNKSGTDATEPTEPGEQKSEQPSRRDFLRQTGGAVAAAANPALMAQVGQAMQAVGLLDHLSDQELLRTPEHEWLDKLSPARLQQLVLAHPEHGVQEGFQKLIVIMTYGAARAVGFSKRKAEYAADKAAGASKALGLMAKNWKISQSDLLKAGFESGMFETPDTTKAVVKAIHNASNAYDIEQDLGPRELNREAHRMTQISQERSRQANKRHQEWRRREQERKRQEQDRHRQETDDAEAISRWENEGGATFEERLNGVLTIGRGG
jgi:hypothetical protein